jgi:hypothetical protein
LIIANIKKGQKDIYIPNKLWLGTVLQPLFPNFMRNKVVGLSIGKVHCMCWDTHGILYTWGNRTIALGYP